MIGESQTEIWFTDKKPLFIVAGESWRDDLEDEIGIEAGKCQCQLNIHLSRENLKRLFIVIQERLKDEVQSAVFPNDRKLHINLVKEKSA